jgi:4-azaleucine resistance transporter AzlC
MTIEMIEPQTGSTLVVKTQRRRMEVIGAGVRSMLPILLGVVPFGLVVGVAAQKVGFSTMGAALFSVLVFAGASQLAAINLMAENAPVLIIVLTGLVINLRMMMYSASIAPHFSGRSPLKKAFLAYFLTDQAYALSMSRYARGMENRDKAWFYLGGGGFLWMAFLTSTAVGASMGARIPGNWSLDFAVPLTFLALLAPVLRDRVDALSALVAGVTAVLCHSLPYNIGLLLAAAVGIGTGFFLTGKGNGRQA